MNTVEFTMPVPNPKLGCPMIGELEVKATVTERFDMPIYEVELHRTLWMNNDVLPLLKSLEGNEDVLYHIRKAAITNYKDQVPAITGEGAEAESEL